MDTVIQVLLSGMTLGSMYALSAIGLSLIWGALGMLNMAHGALLAIGGYACFAAMTYLGLPAALGLLVAMMASGAMGILIYHGIVRFMYRHPAFETNVIIATIGLAIFVENAVLKIFGAYPYRQPLSVAGGIYVGSIYLPFQNVLTFSLSVIMVALVALLMTRSRMGRAIRATAMNREAAQLMGVPVGRVYAQVMAISGALAAVSGTMLSSITTLSPTMGYDPMVKAFIICAIAGLRNVYGAMYAAFFLGIFEAVVGYTAGVRFGFPAMLLVVIVTLIWRPYGVFGRSAVTRV